MAADEDREPGPAQDREVRRLLADARHTEPMPVDVSARLERVLAELAEQQATRSTGVDDPDPTAPGTVTQLASRRRRRAATLLVAAAAVVAVGVGLGQLVDVSPTGSGSGSADNSSAGEASADSAGPSAARSRPERSGVSGSQDAPDDTLMALPHPVRVRADHFSADVAKARRTARQHSAYAAEDRHRRFQCATGDWGRGTLVPVRYDGNDSVLVLRPVTGDSQVVDLFACGGSDVVRSITLPAR
ncbi:hypothetical protein ACT8ZV_15575 [Nocardioides sp. MAHUQ-72]|uniref:hypothetical protein n=1 Tax=unclassified Nocardioides TaxID=2615069 RepID=UPI003615DDDA